MLLTKLFPLLFLLTSVAQAAAPSGETWFTLITPNFRVHHTAPLEIYARAFARALERGLPLLEKDMQWELKHKPLDIVVMDPSDSANGLAMNFPNTHIEVYSMAFEPDSPLSHYVNWVNELATHELTHIVANDTTRGFYSTLRFIFGSWVKPNGMEPSWMSEGLAVFEETSHSDGGRGRSPLLEAMLRTAVREDVLNNKSYTSLDRFNDGNPWWPSGHMAYLMGYTIQALPTKENPGFPGRVSFENADQLPFFPNSAAEDAMGRDWFSVWALAPYRLQERYGKPAPLTPLCQLTKSGAYTGGHALSPDGWIYFSEQDWNRGHHFARVRVDAKCGEGEVERLFHKDLTGPTQVSVSPNGERAAFAAFNRQGFDRLYSDIYLWDVKEEKAERLTDGGRIRDPAFSTNDILLYVRARPDTSEAIIRRDLRDGKEQEIFVSQPLERIAGLNARGDQVAFSLHNNNGQERIHFFSFATGKITRPKYGMAEARRGFERHPYIAADGSIYFAASYSSSTQDIYRMAAPDKNPQRVAANESGYLDRPVLLPDGKTLLVQSYGLNGLDLVRLPIDEKLQLAERPKQDLHEFLTGEKPKPVELAPEVAEVVPYSAFSTPATSLWPQYWLPEILTVRDGTLIGASTSGNDPLEYHRYGLSAQYDTRAGFPTYLAYYFNRTNPVNFLLQANQINDYFSGTRTSNRSALYSAQAIVPIGESSYGFGAAFQERSLFGIPGQNTILFQNFNHANFGKTAAALAPNYGHLLSLYVGFYPRARNENFFTDLRPKAGLFTRGFHPSHSVSLVGQAGITTNSILANNYYQGGGSDGIANESFLVRGYPTDVLFGQRIATANFAYTLPLAHPYRGFGTFPLFIESLGLRFMGDAGSANFTARYVNDAFRNYEAKKFMRRGIAGAGADLLVQGSIFYHVPVTLVWGAHYGFNKRAGGEMMYVFGLNVGSLGPAIAQPSESSKANYFSR